MVRWLSDDQDTTPRKFLSQIRDVIIALAASLKDDMEQEDE